MSLEYAAFFGLVWFASAFAAQFIAFVIGLVMDRRWQKRMDERRKQLGFGDWESRARYPAWKVEWKDDK